MVMFSIQSPMRFCHVSLMVVFSAGIQLTTYNGLFPECTGGVGYATVGVVHVPQVYWDKMEDTIQDTIIFMLCLYTGDYVPEQGNKTTKCGVFQQLMDLYWKPAAIISLGIDEYRLLVDMTDDAHLVWKFVLV